MRKVNKTQARKLYNDGKTIRLVPCKCAPTNPYKVPNSLSCDVWQGKSEINTTFDRIVNSFEAYNCMHETGYYAHYYVI